MLKVSGLFSKLQKVPNEVEHHKLQVQSDTRLKQENAAADFSQFLSIFFFFYFLMTSMISSIRRHTGQLF